MGIGHRMAIQLFDKFECRRMCNKRRAAETTIPIVELLYGFFPELQENPGSQGDEQLQSENDALWQA